MTAAKKPASKKPAADKASVKPADAPKGGGLGLESMGDLSALLDAPGVAVTSDGKPLELEMDLIDEDPNQPRKENNPGFTAESLGELAESIRLRGVKTPISVRTNPDNPGRLLLNHGARRFRASKIAGKATIPGFIDDDYNEADQVVENLLRDELTAREIADYIGRELAKGVKKGEIAKNISKSAAFVTQHSALLDLPEPIAAVFNTGRVRDVTVVNELVTAYKKKPEEVEGWLADEGQEITRGSVKLLREFLDDKRRNEEGQRDPNTVDAFTNQTDNESDGEEPPKKPAKQKGEPDPEALKKAIVMVKHDERMARLVTNRRPEAEGYAWIKYEDDGHEISAELVDVQLMALMEG